MSNCYPYTSIPASPDWFPCWSQAAGKLKIYIKATFSCIFDACPAYIFDNLPLYVLFFLFIFLMLFILLCFAMFLLCFAMFSYVFLTVFQHYFRPDPTSGCPVITTQNNMLNDWTSNVAKQLRKIGKHSKNYKKTSNTRNMYVFFVVFMCFSLFFDVFSKTNFLTVKLFWNRFSTLQASRSFLNPPGPPKTAGNQQFR